MAKQIVTTEIAFEEIPALGEKLFTVRGGLEAETALRKADCLYESVQSLLADAMQNGMSSETAYLCDFAMDAAYALRQAAGVAA